MVERARKQQVKQTSSESKRRRTELNCDQDRRQREQEIQVSKFSSMLGECVTIDQPVMENIMLKSVALTVSSLNVGMTQNTLLELADFAQDYIGGLCAELHRFTLLQRRQQPSVADLALLMKSRNLHTGPLEGEMERDIVGKDVVSECVERVRKLESTQIDSNQDSVGFFSSAKDSKFKQLVPSKRNQLEYIPKWMPQFPPDHTYLSTPQFVQRVTDPRQLREEIVIEGRFAEDALRRLIGVVRMDDNITVDDDNNDNNDTVKVKPENDPEDGEAEDYEFEVDHNHEVKLEVTRSIKLESSSQSTPAITTGSVAVSDTNNALGISTDSALTALASGDMVDSSDELVPGSMEKNNIASLSSESSTGPSALTICKPTSTKMTVSERNKYDPFGVKTTSKKFDVLSYISKRREVLIKRDQRLEERAKLERETGRYGISNDTEFYSKSVRSVVDREYHAAFASIQRSKGRGQGHKDNGSGVNDDGTDCSNGQFIIDTGVVNNDRNRYVL